MGQPGFWEVGSPGEAQRDSPWGEQTPLITLKGLRPEHIPWGPSITPSLAEKDQRTSFPTQSCLASTGTGRYMPGCCGNRSMASKHEWLIFRKVPLVPWPHSRVSNAVPSDSAPRIDSVQRIMGVPPLTAGAVRKVLQEKL